jgi:hypothetical protein
MDESAGLGAHTELPRYLSTLTSILGIFELFVNTVQPMMLVRRHHDTEYSVQ